MFWSKNRKFFDAALSYRNSSNHFFSPLCWYYTFSSKIGFLAEFTINLLKKQYSRVSLTRLTVNAVKNIEIGKDCKKDFEVKTSSEFKVYEWGDSGWNKNNQKWLKLRASTKTIFLSHVTQSFYYTMLKLWYALRFFLINIFR